MKVPPEEDQKYSLILEKELKNYEENVKKMFNEHLKRSIPENIKGLSAILEENT